jgi:hypothetical protein
MFIGPARKLLAGAFAVACCLVLFGGLAPNSASTPQGAGVPDATISPLALMMPPPNDLPIERFDVYPKF